jgi:hypothetical protein
VEAPKLKRVIGLRSSDARIHSITSMAMQMIQEQLQDAWRFDSAPDVFTNVWVIASKEIESLHPGVQADGSIVIRLLAFGDYFDDKPFSLPLPFRQQQLCDLLNGCSSILNGQASNYSIKTITAPLEAAQADEVTAINTERLAWLNVLLQLSSDSTAMSYCTKWGDGLKIEIQPAESIFFAHDEALQRISVGNFPESAEWTECTLPTATTSIALDMEKLLWLSGLHFSNDTLHPSLPPGAHFSMQKWPDFGIVGHQPHFIRLSAMFAQSPQTVSKILQMNICSESKIIQFLNATTMLGILKVEPTLKPVPATVNKSKRMFGSFVGLIRKSIGI